MNEREFLGLKRDEVRLVAHDARWDAYFLEVKELLQKIHGENAAGFYHVGSTAIPNIMAKPILDVAVALKDIGRLNVQGMEEAGYTDGGTGGIEGRRYFVKRYDGNTLSTQHIHLYAEDSPLLQNQLSFCHALQADPALAREYEALKLSLYERDPKDRAGYTDSKTDFINRVLSMHKD